jgi:NAD(P) transhydrogenase subunit alpha
VPGENRVALVPDGVAQLAKKGNEVLVQSGAGVNAGHLDSAYEKVGARIVPDAATLFNEAEMVVKVQKPVVHPVTGKHEIEMLREGAVLVTFFQPLVNHDLVRMLKARNVTSFSMDAIPRTTRAQTMDALSSMSTIAGYKAVLLAGASIGRFFPLLMTAAGSVPPAKVLVLGAGVAGLMAIATARRLGAVVEANDVRAAVKEQVESLGAKFVDTTMPSAEGAGGYAKELTEEDKKRQQEILAKHVMESDVVITTALIPGRPAPRMVTKEMVQGMKPGSVIVDLAAENGGNCELTEPGCDFVKHNVRIIGPLNVPSSMPIHASQLYSKNVLNLLALLIKDGQFNLNMEDDIVAGTVITHNGQITHGNVRAAVEPALEGSPA